MHPSGACIHVRVRVHVCAILTRSRARAGVSVRLLFACTLRVRGVTSLRFGRYASGACVCVHTCGVREFHAPSGCICDRAARALRTCVHVSAPCGCVISFFEAHSPLRSAARETTLRVGSASLPKNKCIASLRFARLGNVACHLSWRDRGLQPEVYVCVPDWAMSKS